MGYSPKELAEECDRLGATLATIERTFVRLAGIDRDNSEALVGYSQMLQWARDSAGVVLSIKNGLLAGVSDTAPYIDFLANLEADIIEVRNMFAIEAERLRRAEGIAKH